jgi:hypothetical protein
MTPDAELRVSPGGSAGTTLYELTVPVTVDVSGGMLSPIRRAALGAV